MLRALFIVLWVPLFTFGADSPDTVAKTLAVQAAMRDARAALKDKKAGDAARILEGQLSNADGNPEFLDLLRQGYEAELHDLQTSSIPNESRTREVTTRLGVLGKKPQPVAEIIPASAKMKNRAEGVENLRTAVGLFKSSQFRQAAVLFAQAVSDKVELKPDQQAAWAYCRVKVAAEELNKPNISTDTKAKLVQEIEAALALAPTHEGLQKAGQDVLATARQRVGSTAAISTTSKSIMVKGAGDTTTVSKAAEAKRAEIFARWSGPAVGAWVPACEIVIHNSAQEFSEATKRPAANTGMATISLEDSVVKSRVIHLRADDASYLENALPRELAHVVLADLFPSQAPPAWAEVGIAVRECSKEERQKYLAHANTTKGQEGFTVAELLALKGYPPANRTAAFYAKSAAVVDYLASLKGEKAFTTFLRDWQRYGGDAALRRNYNMTANEIEQSLPGYLAKGK